MNAQTKIRPPGIADLDGQAVALEEFMVAWGILRIGRHGDNFNVYVEGNKMGCGKHLDEALDSARGLA